MVYRLLADATVVLHLLFVAFVLLGGGLVLWKRRWAWLHLPAALWGAWVELTGAICPLTPLESWLRRSAGEAAYGAGFVEHYIVPVLYPGGLTRELQWALGGIVVLVNAAVYALILRRPRPMR